MSSTRRAGAEHELDARLDHLAEALVIQLQAWTGACRTSWSLDELERLERLEPDAIGGLVDDERELCLHPRPYVLELGTHGSVDPLLFRDSAENYS